MYYSDSQEPELELAEEEDNGDYQSCSQGHQSSLCLNTQEGGTICLLCFSNLISDPLSPTVHVSYALSQFSQALSQPTFLQNFLTFHSHFIVSPVVEALCSFDDEPIARQVIDLIRLLCDMSDGDESLCDDFIFRVSDRLSSGSLAWSRRQVYMLHCFGILLSYRRKNLHDQIKDKDSLISSLVAGLELPSEEIRGEILFVLYKLSLIQYASNASTETDVLSLFCPKLIYLALEALMKTQNDDVRLNCVALLTVLTQRGLLGNEHENYTKVNEKETDEPPLNILLAEAIKGPLLSSDEQVQISTLDLIIRYLCSEGISIKEIQSLVEESIVDYVFEILRFSEGKDSLVKSCLQALDLLSKAEQPFNQRLAVGFATLIPVLRYVASVPFHPAHAQTLNLIWKCISQCPGAVSASHIQELVLNLTGVLQKNINGEMGILPDTFATTCSILVTIMKSPSYRVPHLARSVRDVLEHVVLSCLSIFEKQPTQLLHSLYLLKESYIYSHGNSFVDNSIAKDLQTCILDVCATRLLPWLLASIHVVEEELVLGVLETFHSVLLQDPDMRAIDFANTLASTTWFSFSFGCLGLFPSEKMKWRVYLMLSSLVDVILDNSYGQCIREVVSFLPSDPVDLLFLLGQKSSKDSELSSCQSAILLLLYTSSLHNDRLADDKMVLASLEQYILVSHGDLLCERPDPFTVTQLVHVYGLYRSVADTSCQIPYSPEAERILFKLVNESEWDLHSSRIHGSSLKWLFYQEKIRNLLCYQILKICQILCPIGTVTTLNKQFIGAREIGELVAAGENYAAMFLICLLEQLIEEGAEQEIVSVVNFMLTIIKIFPSCADQLRLHGVGNAIRLLYYGFSNLYSQQTWTAISLLAFSILRSGHSKSYTDDEVWHAVTVKLLDCLSPVDTEGSWTPDTDSLLVIAIASLVLRHSTNGCLFEASKTILFNTFLASAIKTVFHEACSKGPALIDDHEGTNMGKTIILSIFLVYFSMKSLQVVLPGVVDWQNNLGQSNETRLSFVGISCHDLCRLLHFGSPSIKLVTSYCLLELFTRLSEQITNKQGLRCTENYLKSVVATLEGLVVYDDHRVATNCSLCLSMVLEWRDMGMHEARVIEKNKWCRIIVEEWAASISVPCLASNAFIQHKPAVYVAVALLKLQKVFGWMRSIFDEACISGIIENVTATNLNMQVVSFFRQLLNSQLMQAEQIASLNSVLQACRKQIYHESDKVIQTEEQIGNVFTNGHDDLEEVCEYLVYLMQSDSSSLELDARGLHGKQRLLDEIELFFRDLAAKHHS